MAQVKRKRTSFDQVLKLVDDLSPDERDNLRRRLEFQSWDEQWDQLKRQLTEKRTARGLPPPTDEEIHAEIDAHRSPEALEALRREIAIGLSELDRGEGIPAEQVFAELRARHKTFSKTGTD